MILAVAFFVTFMLLVALLSDGNNVNHFNIEHYMSNGGMDDKSLIGSRLLKDFISTSRIPGSEEHLKVQYMIIDFFKSLNFKITTQTVFEMVPEIGEKRAFRNIMASSKPLKESNIVMAAHYDTKPDLGKDFVGALDSGWSCVCLMSLAAESANENVVYLFIDGEESWGEWGRDRSMYGSRNLAKSDIPLPKTLVLLDLLGGRSNDNDQTDSGTTNINGIPSYFRETDHFHYRLSEINSEIFMKKRIIGHQGTNSYLIEDDHVPFHQEGSSILHLIPFTFPKEWHTLSDNIDALDPKNCKATYEALLKFLDDL